MKSFRSAKADKWSKFGSGNLSMALEENLRFQIKSNRILNMNRSLRMKNYSTFNIKLLHMRK